MKKQKEIKQEINKKSNKRIESIIKDYPLILHVHPRSNFEAQLRNHLIKHNIK